MRLLMPASSSPKNSPVFLLSAMKLGELGEGMFEWVQSWPFEVQANTVSSAMITEQFDALCGNTPSSSIMSYFQMMSASLGPIFAGGLPGPATYCASSLNGPSLPLDMPFTSRHMTSQRLVTRYTRSPSTVGDDRSPRFSQSLTLPDASLG